MIRLTRLGPLRPSFVLNCELIRTVEATPDTVITLTSGDKLLVGETVDRVIELVVEYRATCQAQARVASGPEAPVGEARAWT